MKRNGFTLIELIIVIGIVATLAAIIFPVFLSVREKGRRTACLSNERQIGIGMLQYVSDAGETFPSGLIWAGDKWASGVYPYVKSIALFECPDGHTDTHGSSPGPQTGFPLGYGLNSNLGARDSLPYPAPAEGFELATLTAPAKTVLLFEVEGGAVIDTNSSHLDNSAVGNGGENGSAQSDGHGGTLTDATYPIGGGHWELATYATGNLGGRLLNGATKGDKILNTVGSTPRHAGGANYVACDGHAIWLSPERVSGGDSAVATDCLQGTEARQPGDCAGQTEEKSAGTADTRHALTFSIR